MFVRKREPAEIIEGAPCVHGHGTRRYARFGGCVECVRLANTRAPADVKRRLMREWSAKNRDYVNAQRVEYSRLYPERTMLNSCRRVAKQQGIPFDLTVEDIVIPECCPVLGVPLEKGRKQRSWNSPSLDRIIPERGYVRGNVIVVSWRVNRIKADASIRELELIAAFYKGLN
jgi:hypothetical protein